MLKPEPIQPGNLIALVQPSGAVRSANGFQEAVTALENLGYTVLADNRRNYGNLAGTDKERAAELNSAFANKDVKAIICMKGGYGTPRILDLLDYESIKRNPKIFIGYSDVTALHIAFNELCELITYHGPMPASCFPLDETSLISFTNALGGSCSVDRSGLNVINAGVASGRLCGGNLPLVAGSLGTKWSINVKGKILLLEDVDEHTYRVDHMLTQLRLAGVFDECAGVVLGDFTNCTIEFPEFGLTLDEIFRDIIAPCGKPVVSGLPVGHGEIKLTVPLGGECAIDGDRFMCG